MLNLSSLQEGIDALKEQVYNFSQHGTFFLHNHTDQESELALRGKQSRESWSRRLSLPFTAWSKPRWASSWFYFPNKTRKPKPENSRQPKPRSTGNPQNLTPKPRTERETPNSESRIPKISLKTPKLENPETPPKP